MKLLAVRSRFEKLNRRYARTEYFFRVWYRAGSPIFTVGVLKACSSERHLRREAGRIDYSVGNKFIVNGASS